MSVALRNDLFEWSCSRPASRPYRRCSQKVERHRRKELKNLLLSCVGTLEAGGIPPGASGRIFVCSVFSRNSVFRVQLSSILFSPSPFSSERSATSQPASLPLIDDSNFCSFKDCLDDLSHIVVLFRDNIVIDYVPQGLPCKIWLCDTYFNMY